MASQQSFQFNTIAPDNYDPDDENEQYAQNIVHLTSPVTKIAPPSYIETLVTQFQKYHALPEIPQESASFARNLRSLSFQQSHMTSEKVEEAYKQFELQHGSKYNEAKQAVLRQQNRYGIVDYAPNLERQLFAETFGRAYHLGGPRYLDVAGPKTMQKLLKQSQFVADAFKMQPQHIETQNLVSSLSKYIKAEDILDVDLDSIKSEEDFRNLELPNGLTLQQAVRDRTVRDTYRAKKNQKQLTYDQLTPAQKQNIDKKVDSILIDRYTSWQSTQKYANDLHDLYAYGADDTVNLKYEAPKLRTIRELQAHYSSIDSDEIFMAAACGQVNPYNLKDVSRYFRSQIYDEQHIQYVKSDVLDFESKSHRLARRFGEDNVALASKLSKHSFDSHCLKAPLDLMIGGEGDYTAARRNGMIPGGEPTLTQWPLSEVIRAQVPRKDGGIGYDAMGCGQFIPDTMKSMLPIFLKHGLTLDTQYDKACQQKMIAVTIETQCPTLYKWVTGRIEDTPENFKLAKLELAKVWRSFPDPRPGSNYDKTYPDKNKKSNRAKYTNAQIDPVLRRSREVATRLKGRHMDETTAFHYAWFHEPPHELTKTNVQIVFNPKAPVKKTSAVQSVRNTRKNVDFDLPGSPVLASIEPQSGHQVVHSSIDQLSTPQTLASMPEVPSSAQAKSNSKISEPKTQKPVVCIVEQPVKRPPHSSFPQLQEKTFAAQRTRKARVR